MTASLRHSPTGVPPVSGPRAPAPHLAGAALWHFDLGRFDPAAGLSGARLPAEERVQ
ncbi:hypothetical protein [Pseudogemmobacter sonorensis]|uniref:hypothetical protein n=1 Tax=Pseudogemmobacter sonorensis TaxID=2989681 RepID=UPI0036752D0A